ncbi:MAG TPA: GerMN domain-containing protein [Candidatus Hydrogenedens sp.]|nr:GerMN domain-containing protein [Candidatus Hydrogenedens sp.]
MNKLQKRVIRKLFVTVLLLITVMVVILLLFTKQDIVKENLDIISTFINTSLTPTTIETNNPSKPVSPNVNITIYVISKEGECFQPIDAKIEWKLNYQENCKQVINTMKNIKSENYISPIPEDISPRGIFLTPDGELIVDLPSTIIAKYEKNTTALFESLFTYSIVNSLLQKELTANVLVRHVRFIIEGSLPLVEFPRHISWAQSFTPNYSLLCKD